MKGSYLRKKKINCQTTEFKEDKEEFDFRSTGTIYVENGCLSTDELKKLTQCIREIEQNDTKRLIKIWMDTPEKTVKEIEDVLNRDFLTKWY